MNKVYSVIISEDNGFRQPTFPHVFSSMEKALNAFKKKFPNQILKQIDITTDDDNNTKLESTGLDMREGIIHSLFIDTKRYDFEQVVKDFENADENNYGYDWIYILEMDVV